MAEAFGRCQEELVNMKASLASIVVVAGGTIPGHIISSIISIKPITIMIIVMTITIMMIIITILIYDYDQRLYYFENLTI